jgi:hypothetical protein
MGLFLFVVCGSAVFQIIQSIRMGWAGSFLNNIQKLNNFVKLQQITISIWDGHIFDWLFRYPCGIYLKSNPISKSCETFWESQSNRRKTQVVKIPISWNIQIWNWYMCNIIWKYMRERINSALYCCNIYTWSWIYKLFHFFFQM